MIEQIGENRDITVENVLQEGKQNLSDLKKEIDVQKNIDFADKIPPKLKNIYKKFLNVHSKKDIKKIQLDGGELEIFVNLFQQYSYTKLGSKVIENLETIFNAQGNILVRLENFGGLKLAVVQIGGQELFAINHTVADGSYSPRTVNNTPIVVDRSSEKCFVRDIEGNKLEGRYAIMPDGNLLPIDENGNYPEGTYFFRDLSFKKGSNQDFAMNKTSSVEVMYQSLYEKKKEKIGMMTEIKSLENMGYVLDRDDTSRNLRIKKNNIKSPYSESLLSYQTDRDFLKWMEDAKASVDSGVTEIEKQEAKFEDFYNKYFNDNAVYKNNERYEIVREGGTNFHLLDRENKNKKVTANPLSIFDERGRLLTDNDIDGLIKKYEAEMIYLKFIAKNNTKDTMNLQGEHAVNTYYLGYEFEYKNHMVKIESSPVTDRKYAIVVHEKGTKKYKGKVLLDNFMSASDIEKQIDNLIRQKN